MKRNRILAFLICLIMLVSSTTPAFAAQSRTITVSPINVMVGGKVFLPTDPNGKNVPVFVYNGTTYAPLRALAEAYGLQVGYDSDVTFRRLFKKYIGMSPSSWRDGLENAGHSMQNDE